MGTVYKSLNNGVFDYRESALCRIAEVAGVPNGDLAAAELTAMENR